MIRYITGRICTLVLTMFVISVITFAAFCVLPGDAAIVASGTNASQETIEQRREEMGLNAPVVERYINWIKGVFKGDFGKSLQYTDFEVNELVAERMPYTIMLAIMSVIIVIGVSIPLGIFAVRNENSIINTIISVLTQIFMAVPEFFLGILMTYIFGLLLNLFQAGMYVSPTEDFIGAVCYMIFPALSIALPKIATTTRYVKSSVSGQMSMDYVRTARSKGLSEHAIMYRHVLKNALIPVISFVALIIVDILAGSIIVEQVFGIPGLGRMLVTAISNRDYPVVQACVLYITFAVVITNIIADIAYRIVDPRVQLIKEVR
ncbi:MAG: ABC transporter permease [Eubacterium sp.]